MRDPVQRNVPPRPGGGGGEAPGPGRRAGQADATGTMSIGEVLGILKPEFPDITVSKIRFLEGAGLVQPDRSASGYRKFSEDDVARLRFVLRAQRDQYLPLRVIRQRLADLEKVGDLDAKGGLPPDPTSQPDPGAPAAAGTPGSGAAGAGPAAGAGAAGAGVGAGAAIVDGGGIASAAASMGADATAKEPPRANDGGRSARTSSWYQAAPSPTSTAARATVVTFLHLFDQLSCFCTEGDPIDHKHDRQSQN